MHGYEDIMLYTVIKSRLRSRINIDRIRTVRRIRSLVQPKWREPPEAPLWKKRFRHILILDTSCASDNIGDEIIFSSAAEVLKPLFADAYISTASSHDGLGQFSRSAADTADIIFLIGTNALSPEYNLNRKFIWNVNSEDIEHLKGKVVLFGVGANKYFNSVENHQIGFLQEVLSKDFIHSTRDSLGAQIVNIAGRRALVTSCPTLWKLAQTTPPEKSESVCFTLTGHKPSPLDKSFIDILCEHYRTLYFWPQQPRDYDYLCEIVEPKNIVVLPPNLMSYDGLLRREAVDVIGTRLHGTIRGIQHGKRGIVISIDNRAREIAEATGLSAVERSEIEVDLARRINQPDLGALSVDTHAVGHFLAQFNYKA